MKETSDMANNAGTYIYLIYQKMVNLKKGL